MANITVDTSSIVDGQQIDAADVTVPVLQLKAALEDILEGVTYPFEFLSFKSPVSVSISGDALTLTQLYSRVETEGSVSTDNVNNITATGNIVVLQLNTGGQTITFKHNSGGGNVYFADGRDYVLSDTSVLVVLRRNTQTSKWVGETRNMGNLWLTDSEIGTLVSDTLTVTRSKMTVAAQTGTTDNLATISNPLNLDVLFIIADAGDTITVQHNVGNIWIPKLANHSLVGTTDMITLVWNDVVSKWIAVGLDYVTQTLEVVASQHTPSTTLSFDKLILPRSGFTNLGSNDIRLDYATRPPFRRILTTQALGGTTYGDVGGAWQLQGATVANDDDASSGFIVHTTSTTNGNTQGRRTTATPFQWRHAPSIEVVMKVPSVGETFVLGFMDAVPTYSSGFVFPSNFYGIVSASSGTEDLDLAVYQGGSELFRQTIEVSGGTPANVLIRYRLWIDPATDTIYYQRNDNSVISNVISGISGLDTQAVFAGVIAMAVSGTAEAVSISRIHAETN